MDFKVGDKVICVPHPDLTDPATDNVRYGEVYTVLETFDHTVHATYDEGIRIDKGYGTWTVKRFAKLDLETLSKLERIIYGVKDERIKP